MKNVTLSIEDDLLEAGRAYARTHRTTLNSLMRDLLARTVNPQRQTVAEELFRLMDETPGRPEPNYRYRREDAYDV